MFEILIIFWLWSYFYTKLQPKENISIPQEEIDSHSNAPINLKIRNIDVSNISEVYLIPHHQPMITIKTKNFFRIAKAVVGEMKKNEFAPNELRKIYDYILANYESSLPVNDFIQIKTILGIFVESGWRVEIIYGTPKIGWNRQNSQATDLWWTIFRWVGWIFSIISVLFWIAVIWWVIMCGALILGMIH